MLARKVRCINYCPLKRYSASLLDKKIAKDKRQQQKELKRLEQLQNTERTQNKTSITTELSSVKYEGVTAPGDKKDVTQPLPQTYSPKFVESCWYQWWEKQGYFQPSKQTEKHNKNKVFSMVIPPPNVTGKLHLGHALTVTLEDVLCRWNRMKGNEVVWVPGCDHAGIATQAVVEKLLEAQNMTRHELGKENFVKEVWKWKDNKEEEIYNQLRVLGVSLDWTRTNFTLDSKFSKAVREAFIRLYEKGIIYRSKSLINWSCQLQSTISGIEIDNKAIHGPTMIPVPGYKKKTEFGVLHTFDYPLLNPTSDRDSISVSTTRIETMLGDTAIAVNPDDTRYSSLIGSFVRHPLLDGVSLPIVADSRVQMDFGTGAVKITPAHDFYDFELGARHHLPTKNILDDNGSITNTKNPAFDNLPRFIAREKVIEALHATGLYKGKQSHEMNLPLCSRSGDVIEPRIMTQWFLKIETLAEQAMEYVKTGQIRLEPDSHTAAWNNWLTESGDWCISRQLWWGHQIPAYEISVKGKKGDPMWVSAHNEEEARAKVQDILGEGVAESLSVEQDNDVLDTWFSSALFPFACFGWPDDTKELRRYYPLSVMETGYDLLFFWVARMTMLGFALTGQAPFKDVYLHTMVRDAQGRKMSKSLGNVIDPLQVIYGCSPEELDDRIKQNNLSKKEEKYALRDRVKTLPQGILECGTDSLRFYLCFNKNTGRDISLDVHSVVQYRYFCNKIWNAFKFTHMNVEKKRDDSQPSNYNDLRPVDLWILSRLTAVVTTVNKSFEELNFSSSAAALHKFFFHDFADFYLESCKVVFSDQKTKQRFAVEKNLEFVLESFLRLLSPFMPYIAEELWQRLPNREEEHSSIMIAEYPDSVSHDFRDESLESSIDTVRNTIQVIRNVKQMYHVPSSQAQVTVSCEDQEDFSALSRNSDVINHLSKCGCVSVTSQNVHVLSGCISNVVIGKNIRVFLKLKGIVDIDSQIHSLRKKKNDLEDRINNAESEGGEKKKKLGLKIEKARQGLIDVEKMLSELEHLR